MYLHQNKFFQGKESSVMDATTFPISFTWHLVFSILACVFFTVQYVRTKKSYQLLAAIGIPASLCIHIQPENSSLFYSVGVFEAVLFAGVIAFAILERTHRKQEIADTTPLPERSEKAEKSVSSETEEKSAE